MKRIVHVLAAVGALLALAGSAACTVQTAQPGDDTETTDDALSNSQLHGADLPDKTITLTFDDGPAGRTAELATYLHDRGIQATFFVMGQAAAASTSTLKLLRDQGHLVANHTYSHPSMTGTSQPVSELQKTDAIISPYVTQGIFLFRAPYGAWNATVSQKLNAAGYARYVGSVFWDVGGDLTTQYAADWACWSNGISVAECANRYMNEIRARRRGIVLMHDVHSKTIDMVKVMVPKLEAEGFQFARLDAVPNIAARIVQAGGTPGTGPMTLGKIECPDSYHIENVGTAGGKYCTNGTDVWGPFTKAMVAKCLQWGGGDACHTDRWATSLAVAARGTGACPLGAAWDSTTTYCVEGQDAFGPFPKPLVEKCIQWGGGDKACRSARWNRGFLAALQGH